MPGPELCRRINRTVSTRRPDRALRRCAKITGSCLLSPTRKPVLASLELVRDHEAYIEAGSAGVHFEDQLASEKKCGHGRQGLIPTAAHERNLIAARLAADVCGTPTFVLARTDAESAKLITADVDDATASSSPASAPRRLFRLKPGQRLAHCIKRGIAFAEYADLLWWETSTPNLKEAKEFADRKVYPGKMLAL